MKSSASGGFTPSPLWGTPVPISLNFAPSPKQFSATPLRMGSSFDNADSALSVVAQTKSMHLDCFTAAVTYLLGCLYRCLKAE